MSDIKYTNHSTVELYRASVSDVDVARAAWVSQNAESYRKEAEYGRVGGLIDFLVRNHHTSPFEHGQFTFIVHTPIFVAREFMRHRTFSFNEISGRYSELELEFYAPPMNRPLQQTGKVGAYRFEYGSDAQQFVLDDNFSKSYATAADSYRAMLDAGIAKEVARSVLPVATFTTFWATANPLNVMRFLKLRLDETAQYEIREVAEEMADFVQEAMPLTYAAFEKHGI